MSDNEMNKLGWTTEQKETTIYILNCSQSYIRIWRDTSDPEQPCWWGRGRWNSTRKWYELGKEFSGFEDLKDIMRNAPYILARLVEQGY